MDLDSSMNGLESSRLGEDVEFEVSTPRLHTPFYESLKKKYPQAFKRRPSASSQVSDTASVCSDSSFSSAYTLSAAQTVKRPRPQPVAANQNTHREGLPPLPPSGRSKKHGGNHSDDFSIIGSPRRGRLKRLANAARSNGNSPEKSQHEIQDSGFDVKGEVDENVPSNLSKTGEQYGSINSLRSELILPGYSDSGSGKLQKGGDLYSSSRSLQIANNVIMKNRLYKTDSTQSLKDRLKQNQASWNKLLAMNNSPFKDVKSSSGGRHKGSKQEKVNGARSASVDLSHKHMFMNNTLRTLEDIQNRITSQADLAKRKRVQNLSRSHTPNSELDEGSHRFLPVLNVNTHCGLDVDGDDHEDVNDINHDYTGARKVKHMKRLQSPDSHDSAVDLDSVSLQSSPPVSDVMRNTTSQAKQLHVKLHEMLNGHGDGSQNVGTDPSDLRIDLNFLKDTDSDISPRRKQRRSPEKVSPGKENVKGKSTGAYGGGLKGHEEADLNSKFVSSAFLKLDSNEEKRVKKSSFSGTSSASNAVNQEQRETLSPKSMTSKAQLSRDSDDSGFDSRIPQGPKQYSSHDQTRRQNSREDQGELSSEKSANVNQSNSRLHKLRSRQKSQDSKPSTPMKADHSIVTPRGDCIEHEILPTRSHSALKDPISSSTSSSKDSKVNNRPRSASADSRKNRVMFEDEINDDGNTLKPIHRAGSQPILHGVNTDGPVDVPTMQHGDTPNEQAQQKFHSDQDLASSSLKSEPIEEPVRQSNAMLITSNTTPAANTASHDHRNAGVSDTDIHSANPAMPMPKPSKGTPQKVHKQPKLRDTAASLKLRIPNNSLRRASVSSNDNDVNDEVTMITNALENASDGQKEGRSKLPWRRSKGRYTPSEEVEKVQMQAVKNVSQKSHWSSLYLASKANREQANQRPDQMVPANKNGDNSLNSASESEVDSKGSKTPPTKPPRTKKEAKTKALKSDIEPRNVRGKGSHYEDIGGYEDVQIGHISRKDQDAIVTQTLGKNKDVAAVQKSKKDQDVNLGQMSRRDQDVNGGQISRREQSQDMSRTDTARRKSRTEGGYEDIGSYQGEGQMSSELQGEPSSPQQIEGEAVYAVVQKRQSRPRTKTPNVPLAFADNDDTEEEEIYTRPPLPERGYESNLGLSKELSGSRSSLMGNFKDSAKKKFGQLRRALSMERLTKDDAQDSASQESGKVKKSPSLKSLFGKKKSGSYEIGSPELEISKPQPLRSSSTSALSHVEMPRHYRQLGKILSVSPDGTQIIELMKPPHGPFGFFIARGKAKYNHGIFVSRLGDGLPEHFFAGLLGIGDEILEINKSSLRKMALDDIYDLMGRSDKLTLKILPFISRKDS